MLSVGVAVGVGEATPLSSSPLFSRTTPTITAARSPTATRHPFFEPDGPAVPAVPGAPEAAGCPGTVPATGPTRMRSMTSVSPTRARTS